MKIAQETRDIYAPIANRLGMSKIKNELEELAFKYLEAKAYEALRQQVEGRRRATEGLIEELRKTISAKLAEAQVPIIQIDGRIKRLFSIHQKLKRQKIDLDQVYDFMALRIVTHSVKDCYAALGIIHQTWSPVPGRIKDFIAMPRPNGYQSLHTSVVSDRGFPFEVQIRTAEMHRVAEEGIAAHWKYKEGRHGADRDEQYFLWLRQLLEFQQEVRDPQEFLQNLKIELYPEEVYIFTPAGEVKALPRDATPVDFAYAIHTDVGHQCTGARVNGKMVPLRTRLRNGDIVQVITTPGHHPSRDWLNIAVTSRARNKIKHYIHAEEKARSLELGKKVFEKEARRYGAQPEGADRGPAVRRAPDGVRLLESGGGLHGARLRQARGEERARQAGAERGAEGSAGERARQGRQRRPQRARPGGGQDQGPRLRRPDGVPRPLLQSDPRREDHRLHHARQGRVGALGRPAPTSSTCSTTRSARSTSSGTRDRTPRPTRCA